MCVRERVGYVCVRERVGCVCEGGSGLCVCEGGGSDEMRTKPSCRYVGVCL